jgi:hypothetical protein
MPKGYFARKVKQISLLSALAGGLLGFAADAKAAYSFTSIIPPGATASMVYDLLDSNLLGYYQDADGFHGYVNNGNDYVEVTLPNSIDANDNPMLIPVDITTIDEAGVYYYAHFNGMYYSPKTGEYNVLVYQTNPFIPYCTIWLGVSDTKLTGSYQGLDGAFHGLIHTSSGFSTYNVPNSTDTIIEDFSGNTLVGEFCDGDDVWHGYIKSNSGVTTIDFPGGKLGTTWVNGIDQDTLVGFYEDNDGHTHGFTLTAGDFTSIDFPGATDTYILKIDGDSLVGYYKTTDGETYGFVASLIPEPSCIGLIGLGILPLLSRVRRISPR